MSTPPHLVNLVGVVKAWLPDLMSRSSEIAPIIYAWSDMLMRKSQQHQRECDQAEKADPEKFERSIYTPPSYLIHWDAVTLDSYAGLYVFVLEGADLPQYVAYVIPKMEKYFADHPEEVTPAFLTHLDDLATMLRSESEADHTALRARIEDARSRLWALIHVNESALRDCHQAFVMTLKNSSLLEVDKDPRTYYKRTAKLVVADGLLKAAEYAESHGQEGPKRDQEGRVNLTANAVSAVEISLLQKRGGLSPFQAVVTHLQFIEMMNARGYDRLKAGLQPTEEEWRAERKDLENGYRKVQARYASKRKAQNARKAANGIRKSSKAKDKAV